LLKKGDRWSGNLGIEVYSDLVNSGRTDTDLGTNTETSKRGLYPDGSTMSGVAVFTVHSYDFSKWNITAGARLNSFVINVDDGETGEIKLTPSAMVGNLAIMRKLNGKSNLFLSINSGFRAPNIDDLGTLGIVDFRYETPNYNLRPERSLQYQAGYKFAGTRLKGDIFIYRNDLFNIITRNRIGDQVIDGYPLFMKENSERAYIQGFETAWDYCLTEKLTAYGALTYTYGHNITRSEPMRRIPPLFGRLSLEYRLKCWFFNAEWLAAGKQNRLAQGDIDDNRIPAGGTPSWNTLNLNSGCTWKFITIDLSLKNLFNEDYRYHGSGINGYGRSLFLTLQLNI
jgi:outer membrane receptor protein involved in Fe transport